MSRNREQLRVFHDAHALTVKIYYASRDFPREEWFGIRSQLRRAAVSVAANIVEGSARPTERDYLRFLNVALGSSCEVQYLLALTEDLGLAPGNDCRPLRKQAGSVTRQLQRLIDSLANPSRALRREPNSSDAG